MVLNRQDDALRCLRRAVALAPNEPTAYISVSRALLNSPAAESSLAEISASLSRAAALNPASGDANLLLGQMYMLERNWGAAREHLVKAETELPDSPTVHFKLAQVYRRLGDAKDASSQTAIQKQIEVYTEVKTDLVNRMYGNESDPRIYLMLARLCSKHGDYVEAARFYRMLKTLEPNQLQFRRESREVEERAEVAIKSAPTNLKQ